MPLPNEVSELADKLRGIYSDAQAHIDSQLAAMVENPRAFQRRARLNSMQASISDAMDNVDEQASRALGTTNQIYDLGVAYAVDRTRQIIQQQGGSTDYIPDSFTHIDRSAVDKLASDLHENLLAATNGVRDSTKQVIRDVVKSNVLESVVEGTPATQAGKQVEDFLEDNNITAVTYSNGASITIGQYADMAVRTMSALAYNQGIFDSASSIGVEYYEVFDGPECGWTDHDDPDEADGSIRSADDCDDFPISHPNCLRSFGPRPDVTSDADAQALNADNDGSGDGDGEGMDIDELAPAQGGFPATPLSEAEPFGWHDDQATAAQQAAENTQEARDIAKSHNDRLTARADKLARRNQ